ncbi:MAG: hypothetical protein KGQ61_03755 [Planctomycetes bacterium]|nr:hypothetical protein [Planctomycetota bacterium]
MNARRGGRGLFGALLVAAVAAVAGAGELRTWRDATGSFSREAEFVRLDGDVVVLRLEEGREIRVPLAKLSAADRSYVANLTSRPAEPKPDATKPSEPPIGTAAAEAQAKPYVRITVRSYAALLEAGTYLGEALQQPLVAMALPGAMAAATGGKPLAGFDVKRPLVALVPVVDGKPTEIVVFLPFKSAKQARDTLKSIFAGGREVDGLLEMTLPGVPQPVLVRCDEEHAVLSTSAAALAAAPAPGGTAPTADISVRVNYQTLSAEYVATMIDQAAALEAEQRKQLEAQLGSMPGAAQALAGGRWAFDAGMEASRTLATDADSFRLDLTIDRKGRKLALDMALLAKPSSSLAEMMDGFAAVESPFAPPSGAEVLDCVVSVPLNQKARDLIATTVQPAFGKVRELMAPLAAQPGGETAVRAVEAAMAAAREVLSGDRLDQRVSLFAAQQGGMQTLVVAHGAKAAAFGSAFEAAVRALPQVPGMTITPGVKEGPGFRSHALAPAPGPTGVAPGGGPMHLACGSQALALTMGPESLAMGEWALAQQAGSAKRPPIVLRIDPGRLAPLMPAATQLAAVLPSPTGAAPAGTGAGGDNYSNSPRGRADAVGQAAQGAGGYPGGGGGPPGGGGYPSGGYPGGTPPAGSGYPSGGGVPPTVPPAGSGYPVGGGFPSDPNGITPGAPAAGAALPGGLVDLQVKPIKRGIQLDLEVDDGALRAIGMLLAAGAAGLPPGAIPSPGGPGGPPAGYPQGGIAPAAAPPASGPPRGPATIPPAAGVGP